MHWFSGSIAEAVTTSKQRNAIFVVFVEGENDLSAEMDATLDNPDVLKRLSAEDNFLAIKLKSGSANYTHFAQIYQFVPVPSLFFIGHNGTPLEVVCAGVNPEDLASRIDRIILQHRQNQQQGSVHSMKEQSETFITTERSGSEGLSSPQPGPSSPTVLAESSEPAAKIPRTETSENYEVVCDGDVCVKKPVGNISKAETEPITTQPTESILSAEEKMERAKELIEARNREKVEKEKELEKQKELERRSMGQGVAELKRWQQEQELKQIQEERKREKMENELARQRILKQIADDRAERKARSNSSQLLTPVATTSHEAAVSSGDSTAPVGARVQFKLPDGTTHTALFAAADSLGLVRGYLAETIGRPISAFTIWTAFPRRELVPSVDEQTLCDLQLAPSAALLVVERRQANTVVDTTGWMTFLSQLVTTIIYQPILNMWQWMTRVNPQQGESSPESRPQGHTEPRLRYRPPTNVHRLNDDRNKDDDNNTWNGNSTQQM